MPTSSPPSDTETASARNVPAQPTIARYGTFQPSSQTATAQIAASQRSPADFALSTSGLPGTSGLPFPFGPLPSALAPAASGQRSSAPSRPKMIPWPLRLASGVLDRPSPFSASASSSSFVGSGSFIPPLQRHRSAVASSSLPSRLSFMAPRPTPYGSDRSTR